MSFIDDMAAAETRHKRDGFDLQWCPVDPDSRTDEPLDFLNWKPVRNTRGAPGAAVLSPAIVINHLVLCERPSGANAEANHAAFQKSRDRVVAELAQYDQVDSIDDVRLRPITTREEADAVLGELEKKECE